MNTVDQQKPHLIYAEVRPFEGDTSLIITPTREMYHVEASPALVNQVLQRCDGQRSLEDILADVPDAEMFPAIIEALVEGGARSYAPLTSRIGHVLRRAIFSRRLCAPHTRFCWVTLA